MQNMRTSEEPEPLSEHGPASFKETTAWDVYNNEARKVDAELVKDWNASLKSLLLFVSHSVIASITLIPYQAATQPTLSPVRLTSRSIACCFPASVPALSLPWKGL